MANHLSRRQRVDRAYALTLASGGFSLASVVLFVTAVAGATGFGLFFLALVAAAVSVAALRRTVGR
ncbi:hypothetical protein [Paraconexibacter sp.]|uniref:hypothetical protein n=1 Tax=Paraconexibacter sp. TaxID=2949640 RepID=UPI00356864DF